MRSCGEAIKDYQQALPKPTFATLVQSDTVREHRQQC
jgi:hypothetical protein